MNLDNNEQIGPKTVDKKVCKSNFYQCKYIEYGIEGKYTLVYCNHHEILVDGYPKYIQDNRLEIETRNWCPFLKIDNY
jgi:hypothetical protein